MTGAAAPPPSSPMGPGVPVVAPPLASPASSTRNLSAERAMGMVAVLPCSPSRTLKFRCTRGSLTSRSSLELRV